MRNYASTRFDSLTNAEREAQSAVDEIQIAADLEQGAQTVAAHLIAMAVAAPETPQRVHIYGPAIAVVRIDGDDDTPTVLRDKEMKWMKAEIHDELGDDGLKRLARREFVSVDHRVVWLVDLGEDMTRNPKTEQHIAATNAARKAQRKEWREFDSPKAA